MIRRQKLSYGLYFIHIPLHLADVFINMLKEALTRSPAAIIDTLASNLMWKDALMFLKA